MFQQLVSYSAALSVAVAVVSRWTGWRSSSSAYNVAKTLTCVWIAHSAYRLAKYVVWRREMNRRFKGPKAHFLLGNVSDLVKAGGFNEKFFQTLHDKYGEVARFWIFGDLNISVTNPSHANEVYKKCPTRPKETYMFLNYLGDENLLFQKDPVVVKQLRLKYNRMVSNQDALRKVTRVAQEMFEKRDWLDKKGVDIHSMTGPLIYDIMGRVLFGGEWSKSEIGKEIRKNHVYLIENSNVWAFYPFKPWYSSAYRKYASTIKILRHKAGILVDQRKRDIENDKTGKEAQRKDAVTMLCTERREDGTLFFSRALAISTLIGFLNGAYDTTHATTDWLLYHLAKYPDVQKRVQEEIDTRVKGDRVTLEEARSLTYLRAVISESMRLRSTVPVNQRVNLREDVAFGDGGKYVVPKGVNVNIPMALTFRCPAHFPGPKDASEFCPERFLGKSDSASKCSRSHTAFGAQKRMCVGFTFALAELLAITVFMMKRFNVFCVDDNEKGPMKIEAGVNQPDGVLRLRFTRRR